MYTIKCIYYTILIFECNKDEIKNAEEWCPEQKGTYYNL